MLRLSRSIAVLLVSLASLRAASAGTAYVPLTGVSAVGNTTYETRITISNGLQTQRAATYLQMATNVDGTIRTGVTSSSLPVPAGRSVILKPTASAFGLLEVTGPPDFQFSARLVPTSPASAAGVEIPVISSENMAPAGGVLYIHGLAGGGTGATRLTDVTLVNLAQTASSCSVSALRADGTTALPTASISLLPLSHRSFLNIFSALTEAVADARLTVSCTKEFYAFGQTGDTATGEVSFLTPAATGNSSLFPPGDPGSVACANPATCFSFPGVVHVSTRGTPDKTLFVTPPIGVYKSVKVHIDVDLGAWQAPSSGAHGVMYFVRDNNKDMFANVFLKGPSRNSVTLRHGFNQTHAEKAKIEKGISATVGETYSFDYDFNPAARTLSLKISNRGQVISELIGKPNVNMIHIEQGNQVILGLSNPGTNPQIEPASIGWTYRNIKVEYTQ